MKWGLEVVIFRLSLGNLKSYLRFFWGGKFWCPRATHRLKGLTTIFDRPKFCLKVWIFSNQLRQTYNPTLNYTCFLWGLQQASAIFLVSSWPRLEDAGQDACRIGFMQRLDVSSWLEKTKTHQDSRRDNPRYHVICIGAEKAHADLSWF